MSTHETDNIFKEYHDGTKTMEETNEALKEAGANYHLEPLTDEERAVKKIREDEEGTVYNPKPKEVLPQNVDLRRRTDLIGTPRSEREIIQKTVHGTFRVVYDDQGYAVSSTRI